MKSREVENVISLSKKFASIQYEKHGTVSRVSKVLKRILLEIIRESIIQMRGQDPFRNCENVIREYSKR